MSPFKAMPYIFGIVLVLIIAMFIVMMVANSKSPFGNISVEQNDCFYQDRQFPEGNLPADKYLGLNNAEKQNMLVNFIKNNPNVI